MKIRKELTANLTKDDVEEAVKQWVEKQKLIVDSIHFILKIDLGNDPCLEGAVCNVRQDV